MSVYNWVSNIFAISLSHFNSEWKWIARIQFLQFELIWIANQFCLFFSFQMIVCLWMSRLPFPFCIPLLTMKGGGSTAGVRENEWVDENKKLCADFRLHYRPRCEDTRCHWLDLPGLRDSRPLIGRDAPLPASRGYPPAHPSYTSTSSIYAYLVMYLLLSFWYEYKKGLIWLINEFLFL